MHKAIAREKQLKGWTRAKKFALIVRRNPHWVDLASEWYPWMKSEQGGCFDPSAPLRAGLRAQDRFALLNAPLSTTIQLPTYLAYRLRATAVSVVPLMMARPSGNSVIS